MKSIYAEIRRRQVLRVCAVYAVAAWLVLQIGEVTLSPLGFPDWVMRALIVAAVVGFPIVFFLAWVIDVRPDGVVLDLPLWHGDSEKQPEQRKDYVVFIAVAALMIIAVYSVGSRIFRHVPTSQALRVVAQAPANSIAVLAFENFSAEPSSGYFADGLAEEILNRLSGLSELNVAARTSSFQFRGRQIGIREIAEALSVRYVLEGSVRLADNRIKVSAKLIDSRDGYPAFTKSYDRRLEDIFAIQEEIAAGVVNELEIVLSLASEERLQKNPTENLDAYVYYLQGRQRLRSPPDIDVLDAAGKLFYEALKIDPNFSRAYAGICETHLTLYEFLNEIEYFDSAESACDKAAELDPDLSTEIHIARGILYRNRGWYDRAEQQFQTAIATTPSEVNSYIELGQLRMAQGRRAEAEATFLRAVDLKRQYWRAHKVLGNFYYRTERYAAAVRYFEVASRLTPESASAFGDLGAAYWMSGDTDKARAAWDRSLELKPTRQAYTNLGLRYYYGGSFVDAARMQTKALELAPSDHRVWGRLAESCRFIPGRERESREAYTRAAELASENLTINENDWKTMGLLGLYYAHLDQPERALRLTGEAVDLSQRNPEILYFQALVRLQTGDPAGAIDALAEALTLDAQYWQFIESDPDLKSIRNTEDYARLLKP